MEKVKVLFLAASVGVIFIPLSFYLKKFTTIEASQRPKVSYNAQVCTQCKDCPCTYELKDGKKFTVNSTDKELCKVGFENALDNVETEGNNSVIYMDGIDYKHFTDCIKWYSQHPSSF